MKPLHECLFGSYMGQGKGFYNRKHVNDLMKQHGGFHAQDNLWFVREAAGVTIFKVSYHAETSAQPQSETNEDVVLEFAFQLDMGTLASIVGYTARDTASIPALIDWLFGGTTLQSALAQSVAPTQTNIK